MVVSDGVGASRTGTRTDEAGRRLSRHMRRKSYREGNGLAAKDKAIIFASLIAAVPFYIKNFQTFFYLHLSFYRCII